MKNLTSALQNISVKAQSAAFSLKQKLKENRGSFFTENALVIVITVAIAGLVLTLMFAMFKNELAPTLSNKIREFFNYAG
ncbi:MAG: DUF6133 family protein [Oscillospiraceae bacterium]